MESLTFQISPNFKDEMGRSQFFKWVFGGHYNCHTFPTLKCLGCGIRWYGFQSWLCHLALGPWVSALTLLSLTFLTFKRRMVS